VRPEAAPQEPAHRNVPTRLTRRPCVAAHEICRVPRPSALSVLRRETADASLAPKMLAVSQHRVHQGGSGAGRSACHDRYAPPTESSRILEHMAETTGGDFRGPQIPAPAVHCRKRPYYGVARDPPNEAVGFDAAARRQPSGQLSRYRYLHFAQMAIWHRKPPSLLRAGVAQIDESCVQPSRGFFRGE